MEAWRSDFREMADDVRRDDGPEAVARILEHVGDLGTGDAAQLEAGPWRREIEELDYDELLLSSRALTRIRDRAVETERGDYVEPLDRILASIQAEIDRRAAERD